MRIVVIIAALNEEKNVGPVVERIVADGRLCILVDDGSSDRTSEVAAACGARVVRHSVNLGQGHALLTGFKAALTEDSDIIVEMDADGQHDPAEISRFIEAFEASDVDIVVGSRIIGTNHPNASFIRRFFLPYFTGVINRITGYRLTDSMCGFRAFRTSSLRRVHRLLDQMHEPQYLSAEMFIRFARAKLTAIEVPITLHDRRSGNSYKGLVRYGFGVMKAIIRTLLD